MDLEEPEFDLAIATKKKRKKKNVDLDVALGLCEANNEQTKPTQTKAKEEVAAVELVVDSLDLENFGKKKRKKKKAINFSELGNEMAALRAKQTDAAGTTNANEAATTNNSNDVETNLDMDFSMTKKKKKHKKKDLEGLFGEDGDEDTFFHFNETIEEVGPTTWANSDRDYTYDELLQRAFEVMYEKNPDLAAGRKAKFIMRPPQVLRVGTKKTSFANFLDIAKTLHRIPKHLMDFVLAELGTSGSMDGNKQLIIKGRFQPKQIENVLRRYIKEYVTCHTCRSPETVLQKDTRLYFLQCEVCGSRCSVATIKSGFQALTSKRAAIRARYS